MHRSWRSNRTGPWSHRLASSGSLVQPRTVRDLILGSVIGLLLGAGLVVLVEALDTRVYRADEFTEVLGIPLLATLPTPPRKVRRQDGLVMASNVRTSDSDAFRRLRLNVDFANLSVRAKSILVTSGLEQEGKSTTAANLAIAFALVGRRVALVDLDLRRPYIHRFFGLESSRGVTDVALGYLPLEDALVPAIVRCSTPGSGGGRRNGNGMSAESDGEVCGKLEILPTGPRPPSPGEFVETDTVSELLCLLADRADIVIVDAPPLLSITDAIALSRAVDAALLVVKARRPATPFSVKSAARLTDCNVRCSGMPLRAASPRVRTPIGRQTDTDLETQASRQLPWRRRVAGQRR